MLLSINAEKEQKETEGPIVQGEGLQLNMMQRRYNGRRSREEAKNKIQLQDYLID
jgi:hypothetical protein